MHFLYCFTGLNPSGQPSTLKPAYDIFSMRSPETYNFSSFKGPRGMSSKITPTVMHICPHCPNRFSDYFSMNDHLGEVHNLQPPLQCQVCGKGYQSLTGLNLHMELHSGKTHLCPICDSKFTQKGTIKHHLRKVHKMAQCQNCVSVFRIGEEFNQHVLRCHK
ncbi:Zinc finger protein 711 [Plakobranchus ocellatus]|uniref:Zinc finger protein 711 n=1 Tax=Plakobranchus ocellatus TaxID=259542 RepID=A0AAV3ZAH0_9GAST|nr:Zinc finger protein 711 [Plakobranchus ocellatus]